MTTQKFGPFIPTQHSSAAEKEKFAVQFVRFVEGGFKQSQFPKWFYTRLSMCFGHIAHYNQNGFYGEWFSSKSRQHDFLLNAVRHHCYGQPDYTYSDVERQIGAWVKSSGLIDKLGREIAAEIETAERTQLAALKNKYEPEKSR